MKKTRRCLGLMVFPLFPFYPHFRFLPISSDIKESAPLLDAYMEAIL